MKFEAIGYVRQIEGKDGKRLVYLATSCGLVSPRMEVSKEIAKQLIKHLLEDVLVKVNGIVEQGKRDKIIIQSFEV